MLGAGPSCWQHGIMLTAHARNLGCFFFSPMMHSHAAHEAGAWVIAWPARGAQMQQSVSHAKADLGVVALALLALQQALLAQAGLHGLHRHKEVRPLRSKLPHLSCTACRRPLGELAQGEHRTAHVHQL